jgi:hypothetical protein
VHLAAELSFAAIVTLFAVTGKDGLASTVLGVGPKAMDYGMVS